MDHLAGMAPLAPRYEGFILDLWGVIHDGVRPYPGAVKVMERLRARDRRVVLLSNAPRRAIAVARGMTAMGIPPELYDGVMTSGEAIYEGLFARADPWFARLGRRAFWLGPARDLPLLEGLDIDIALRPEDADFVLNIGADEAVSATEIAPHVPALEACRRAELPMLCANPDLVIVREGQRILCAGALAEVYVGMGGEVVQRGKPDAAIYPPTLALLGVPPERVLVVGDALRTDIAGAAAVGLESCWVLGGIHDLVGRTAEAEAEAAAAGLTPIATIPSFVW
jgi:HAD superfamily hydrolase (TIGR01459 family)